MTNWIFLALLLGQGPNELTRFVSRPDPTYGVRRLSSASEPAEFALTSQTWMGRPWTHRLTLTRSAKPTLGECAILIVTGDRVERDLTEAKRLANRSGMAVATLFDVPNQPLWNLREDALIAQTFAKFLESGDADWPALFPMAKSVVKAMDAIQSAEPTIKTFVVTGLSKRGWTTWLVGSLGDSRVVGIAPGLFDFLNIPSQLQAQMKQWGRYSEMLADYSAEHLQEQVATPRGQALVRLVDPFSYRESIKVPTLIIRGSNDPFWTVDATQLYWNQLRQGKGLLTLANEGHGTGDGRVYTDSLAAFARLCARKQRIPSTGSSIERGVGGAWGQEFTVSFSTRARSKEDCVWVATSSTNDFRKAEWSVVARSSGAGSRTLRVGLGSTGYAALYGESLFEVDGLELRLGSPVRVFRLPAK